MINLLPYKEKNKLRIRIIEKKVSVVLVFFIIFLIILVLICFGLRTFMNYKLQTFKDILIEKEEQLENFQFQNFKNIIISTNQKFTTGLGFFNRQTFLSPTFEKLCSLTPASIYFTNFSFQYIALAEESYPEVHISGWAENREDLFEFKKTLENNFKQVYFSPKSWVKPRHIDFSLSFINE